MLSGSTNWTSTGLCTQTNNALVIQIRRGWLNAIRLLERAQADVDAANGDRKKLQSPTLRGFTHKNNANSLSKPIDLAAAFWSVMFSPNTNHPLRKPPEVPNDMKRCST